MDLMLRNNGMLLYCLRLTLAEGTPCEFESLLFQLAIILINKVTLSAKSRGGSVGIATSYGVDGPGIESRWM